MNYEMVTESLYQCSINCCSKCFYEGENRCVINLMKDALELMGSLKHEAKYYRDLYRFSRGWIPCKEKK